MAASIRKYFDELEPEQKLLSQLIYRNHNQHGSTQLLSYYKGLSRHLKLLSTDKLNTVNNKCESAIKSSAQTKLTSQDLKQLFEVQYLTTAAVNLLSETIEITLKSADVVRRSLSKKLFLPLYTMLLAITARILSCLVGIHQHFLMQGNLLSSQLQHIALVQPRLEKLISEHLSLPSCAYSATAAQILLRVQSAQQPDESLPGTSAAGEEESKTAKVSNSSATSSAKKGSAASRNVSTASLLSTGSAMYSGNEESAHAYQDSEDEDAGLFIGDCDAAPVALETDYKESSVQHTAATSSKHAAKYVPAVHKDNESAAESTDFDLLLNGGTINSSIVPIDKHSTAAHTPADSNAGARADDIKVKKSKNRDRESESILTDNSTKKSTSSAVPATSSDAVFCKTASSKEIKEKKGDGKKKHKKSGAGGSKSGGGKGDDIDDIFGGF